MPNLCSLNKAASLHFTFPIYGGCHRMTLLLSRHDDLLRPPFASHFATDRAYPSRALPHELVALYPSQILSFLHFYKTPQHHYKFTSAWLCKYEAINT
ncbi:hypothetical protein TSUD_380520 [Trifolium subterraneum]|uniref:Uncharacterized protein n=1 Tax=Trifolium subterraneum TaxID=3900 RepID=A0A2Z6PE02_TRISU|nr:hypothetical protein TSUD_380520 [Trifolium subterraneum]